jgi:hypothetical protein
VVDVRGPLAGVLDERLGVAQRQRPGGDLIAAGHRDRDAVEVREELQRRLDRAREELRPEARLVPSAVLAAELVDGRLAPPAELHEEAQYTATTATTPSTSVIASMSAPVVQM